MDTSVYAYSRDIGAPRARASLRAGLGKAALVALCLPVFLLLSVIVRLTGGGPASKEDKHAEAFSMFARTLPRSERRLFDYMFGAGETPDFERMRRLYAQAMVTRMLSRDLSASQYAEKKARLFPHGRVRIYGLRMINSVRAWRAGRSLIDQGLHAAPQSAECPNGLWEAQLPPD